MQGTSIRISLQITNQISRFASYSIAFLQKCVHEINILNIHTHIYLRASYHFQRLPIIKNLTVRCSFVKNLHVYIVSRTYEHTGIFLCGGANFGHKETSELLSWADRKDPYC